MNIVCEKNMCTGCNACVLMCSQNAIKIMKTYSEYNAVIDINKCKKCNSCFNVCPQNNTPEKKKPIKWIQGWSNDVTIRENAASGGYATAIMLAFVKSGGIVCANTFKNGKIVFDIFKKESEILTLSGSRYVKSDTLNTFIRIKELLLNGEKVLFIGLPCQVAGLMNYIPKGLVNSLYLIDLICHGTPSVELYEKYMREHKIILNKLEYVNFRTKGIDDKDVVRIVPFGKEDNYTIGFLKCLFFTENCYECKYSGIMRVSDLTLGDSWGSDLPLSERNKGISLAMVMNEKGKELIDLANIHFEKVNVKQAISSNSQLKHPAKNELRNLFFYYIKKNTSFDKTLFHIYPKIIIKQNIKFLLKKLIVKSNKNTSISYGISYKKLK